ncbi:unnamed protein product [Microthlaspi erraticum]|uniref:DUF4218 domain-containing protein n=1 Tax=Microthlaspi erraticum TaxID=1685480 RepID=A0A6D2LJG7_9BRAS|nr:unnamed protein product [Microthlaspi erraticum]
MEHLAIHLPHEAKLGGPVQYRWMYPFERFMYHLKKKAKNKAKVEGSIVEQYVNEEISDFSSYYFESHIETKSRNTSRSDDGDTTKRKIISSDEVDPSPLQYENDNTIVEADPFIMVDSLADPQEQFVILDDALDEDLGSDTDNVSQEEYDSTEDEEDDTQEEYDSTEDEEDDTS